MSYESTLPCLGCAYKHLLRAEEVFEDMDILRKKLDPEFYQEMKDEQSEAREVRKYIEGLLDSPELVMQVCPTCGIKGIVG
jgi:hypothetical protein